MTRTPAIVLLALTGCATSWGITQASGGQAILDEHIHNVDVPMAGITEKLSVTLPLAPEYEPATTTTSAPRTVKPFALACSSDQYAHDVRYHQAFRYGSTWKKVAATFFIAEGLTAAALLIGYGDQPEGQVFGGFFAVDAAVTGALFFAPREDIYRHDVVPIATHVRGDCPDGLELAIGNTVATVDPTGHLGELGDAALDDWMKTPGAPLELRFAGIREPLLIGADERCTWLRERDHLPCNALGAPRETIVTLTVPPGTLTALATR